VNLVKGGGEKIRTGGVQAEYEPNAQTRKLWNEVDEKRLTHGTGQFGSEAY